jgi:hypothetical protein
MSSYTTRSGRSIKKPTFYEPQEKPEDDFGADEYDDEDEDLVNDEEFDEEDTDDEDEADDEDADEKGNLKGFVVDDSEDSEDCD